MVLHILKADSLLPVVREAQGDYGEIYTARLKAAGFQGTTKIYDVVSAQEYPTKLEAGDSVMISGSKLNCYDNDDWILKLIEYIQANLGKVPIFGVCFGHQIIGRAMGAAVGPKHEWEASVLPVRSTEFAKKLFPRLGENPSFQQMHRDQVFEVPSGCDLLFSSDITHVQGFYRKDVLTVQFHPEFDEQIVKIICNTRFQGPQLQDCLERAAHKQDGMVFFSYVVDFLTQKL